MIERTVEITENPASVNAVITALTLKYGLDFSSLIFAANRKIAILTPLSLYQNVSNNYCFVSTGEYSFDYKLIAKFNIDLPFGAVISAEQYLDIAMQLLEYSDLPVASIGYFWSRD